MSKKTEVFKSVLEGFETDEMRDYCADMIDLSPDYTFTIPSSTSLRFHNATQCQPGGHSYHVVMVGTIMNYILGLEYIQEKYPKPKQRDCFRVAACLHDSQKCGDTDHTVHPHPILAADWIKNTSPEHDIDQKLKDYIARLVSVHSGQWTTSKYSDVVLPKPENDAEFLIHLCDYLGSRANLDMIYTQEQRDAVMAFAPLPDPEEYQLGFGKYKGVTLQKIIDNDPEYLIWLRDKADMELREPLKTLIADL